MGGPRVSQRPIDPDVEAAKTVKPRKKVRDGVPGVRRYVDGGDVVQVLYDYDTTIDVAAAERILLDIDKRCGDDVKLILTGAAFIWLPCPKTSDDGAWLRSKAGLDKLTELVRAATQELVKALASKGSRDFVVGVDLYVGEDEDCHAGQFAVVVRHGVPDGQIISKALPVGGEAGYLAGFGTSHGRAVPHVVETALGRTLVLVCHDAQAFNRLTWARIQNAHGVTSRAKAVRSLRRQSRDGGVDYAVNLIHWVEREPNLRTFRVSQKQLRTDHHPAAVGVGAFGFDGALGDDQIAAWAGSIRSAVTGGYAIVR